MSNEYADLALLKLALALPGSDATRDDLLNAALSAASRSIDDHCGRRFYLDGAVSARLFSPGSRIAGSAHLASPEFFSSWQYGRGPIFLVDDIGSVTGLTVEYGSAANGWTALAPDDYLPENAVARGEAITGLVYDLGFPLGSGDRLRVTAKWGWPAVPAQVVQATLILAARLFRRKDTPEGVLGSAEWGTVRLSRTDPDVAELISRFVLPGFA